MPRPNAPVVRFRNPIVALENEPIVIIDQSAKGIDVRNTPSTTYSESRITFNDIASGTGTSSIIDRKMFVEYSYYVSLAAGGPTPGQIISYGATAASSLTVVSSNSVSFTRGANAAAQRTDLRDILKRYLVLVGIGGEKKVGPRALGLNQACNNISLVLNGTTISTKPDQYINAVEWYGSHDLNKEDPDYSMCASYPDLFQTYGDGQDKLTDPLCSYGKQLGREPRGSFFTTLYDDITGISDAECDQFYAAAADSYFCYNGFAFHKLVTGAANAPIVLGEVRFITSSTTRVIAPGGDFLNEKPITMIEPILLPLLGHGSPCGRGLLGVNNFSLDMSLNGTGGQGLASKFFCGETGLSVDGTTDPADANIAATPHTIDVRVQLPGVNQNAKLHYKIYQPHDLPELPQSNIYDSRTIRVMSQKVTPSGAAKGSKFNIQSQSYTVGTIPSRIYVYVAKNFENRRTDNTDTFARIDSLNFQFGNGGYQFSSASSEQLYYMSKEAGLKMSLPMWRDYVGSVMCIDFTKHVNLDLTQYPGQIGNFPFQFKLDGSLLSGTTETSGADYSLYIVVVEEGVVMVRDQGLEQQPGTLNLDINSVPMHYKSLDDRKTGPYGGLSFEDIKRYAHSAASTAQKALPYVQKGLQVGQKILPYAATALKYSLPLLAMAAGMTEQQAMQVIEEHGMDRGMEKLHKRGQKIAAGRVGGGKGVGGRIAGGKVTSKAEMARFLKE